MSGDLERMVYNMIHRYMNGGGSEIGAVRHHERHALVTSYDPERYLAKVKIMPGGQETGWVGIETGHIGDNYGFATGLQPGDGKKTGDQVIIRFQEGDLESAKVVQRIHSDNDKPPTVHSGEMVMWTKLKKTTGNSGLGDDQTEGGSGSDNDQAQSGQGGSGCQFYFKNDGSATWTDGNGATITFDGNGNVTVAGKQITMTSQGDILLNTGSGNAVKINSGTIQVESIQSGTGTKDLLVRPNGSPDPLG